MPPFDSKRASLDHSDDSTPRIVGVASNLNLYSVVRILEADTAPSDVVHRATR
jgi:hypothetical protein